MQIKLKKKTYGKIIKNKNLWLVMPQYSSLREERITKTNQVKTELGNIRTKYVVGKKGMLISNLGN